MKKLIMVVLFGTFFTTQPYTWTVVNKLGIGSVDIKVCTTAGINNCQVAKDVPFNGSYKFDFSEWYNTGLCLHSIIANNEPVTLKEIQENAFQSAQETSDVQEGDDAGILVDLGMLAASIEEMIDMCSSKTLYLCNTKDSNGNRGYAAFTVSPSN